MGSDEWLLLQLRGQDASQLDLATIPEFGGAQVKGGDHSVHASLRKI